MPPGGIAQMLDQNPQHTPRLQAAIDRRKGHRMTNNINRAMSHADTLRTWAAQYITPAAREPFLAGADALDTLKKVQEVLAAIETEIDRREATPYVNPIEITMGMSRVARRIREAIGGTP